MLDAKRQKELNDILFSPMADKEEPMHRPNMKFGKKKVAPSKPVATTTIPLKRKGVSK